DGQGGADLAIDGTAQGKDRTAVHGLVVVKRASADGQNCVILAADGPSLAARSDGEREVASGRHVALEPAVGNRRAAQVEQRTSQAKANTADRLVLLEPAACDGDVRSGRVENAPTHSGES